MFIPVVQVVAAAVVVVIVLVVLVMVVCVAVCGSSCRYCSHRPACTRLHLCRTQAAILKVVGNKMNAMWKKFLLVNPGFSGKVPTSHGFLILSSCVLT